MSLVTTSTRREGDALSAGGDDAGDDRAAAVPRRRNLAYLGLVPFVGYALLFLLVPAGAVLLRAFRTSSGSFTLQNARDMVARQYMVAFRTSITLSVSSAVVGVIFGGLLAYSALSLGRPRWLRGALMTFCGLGAQFGGVPLAFIFISTLGASGAVTKVLADLGWHLYPSFRIYSFTGLIIVYAYFQVPLMVIAIAPAIDGLRVQWKEAAENLGASNWQYWRRVGLPVLAPSILGAFILLFCNAFSAYATAAALTSGQVNLVPVKIGGFLRGNVTASNAQLGQALATGMLGVVIAAMVPYFVLQRRAARWTRPGGDA